MYNLELLHWQEFEQLAGFYLKQVVGEGISRFDGSQDQGRDAVFEGTANSFPAKSDPWMGKWIFQAKHRTLRNATLQSVETKLLSSLKNKELHKIFVKYNFQCDNYVYITNINVSNSFKDEAKAVFIEFCKKHDLNHKNFHVIDYKDFEVYIAANRYVRNAFPSMLQFTDIEDLFLKREEVKNIGFLKAARTTINKFASTDHFRNAIERLDKNSLLMLVGNPKSGKTTITEAIALCYAEEGNYKPYFVRNTDDFFNIVAYLDSSTRALFICDDIFGTHELDPTKLNDWKDYFQSVIGSVTGEHKFLFTTRRYIFEAFADKSGLRNLFPSEQDPDRYVLKLAKLSREERLQILWKHIDNSTLSQEKVDILRNLENRILDSEDFSPEVIRSLVQILGEIEKDLTDTILSHLDNPNQYLFDFFNNITEQKRLLLLAVATSPTPDISEVEITLNTLLEDAIMSPETTFNTFIRQLENSIIKKREYLDTSDVNFYHPTMFDVIIGIFKQDQRYRKFMLNNANVELISLLTILPVHDRSNKLTLSIEDAKFLTIGFERLLKRLQDLIEVIRLINFFEYLNIETAKEFKYFTHIKKLQQTLRKNICEIEFFALHSKAKIIHWINLFDKWTIIHGNEIPLYLIKLAQYHENFKTYDYWRLIFLLEHVKNDFITNEIDISNIEEFQIALGTKIRELRLGLNMHNGRPYTEETWLPLFREVDDLITKMKKSQFGQTIIQQFHTDWQLVKKWAVMAKNRHSGMVKQGHWKREFKKLRNYEYLNH